MLYVTLRQYEYILAVADSGSLTAAAHQLNVSQPSLSVALTRVEEVAGIQIFVRRKGAPIEITPAGYRFIRRIRTLLTQAHEIENGVGFGQSFTIGCFGDIAPWFLAPAAAALSEKFPDIEFHTREGGFTELSDDLAEGRADVVISYDVGFRQAFPRQVVTQVAPVIFCAEDHPLAGQATAELEDLLPYPLILSEEEESMRFFRQLFRNVGLRPDVGQRVRSLEMMRSFAANGKAVGLSYSEPPGQISYDGRLLRTIPIVTPEAAVNINLIWSDLRDTDQQFRDIVACLTDLSNS